MLLNHACFFIPLRRGAQQAVLRQQICASGALLNNNPIRTTRQRRAHGDRHSSLLSRFEDTLLTNNCAYRRGATTLCNNPVRRAQRSVPGSLPASAISVPEVRLFNISKKRQAHLRNAPVFLSICISLQHFLNRCVRQAPCVGNALIHHLAVNNVQALKKVVIFLACLFPALVGKFQRIRNCGVGERER